MTALEERLYPLLLQIILNTAVSAILLKILLSMFANRTSAFRLSLCWTALLLPVVSTFTVYWYNAQPFEVAFLPIATETAVFWRVLVAAWFAGIVFFTARYAYGYRKLVATLKNAREPEDPLYVDIAARSSQEHGVRIRVSTEISAPAVYGLWKPVILLPSSLQLQAMEWKSILLHELGHVLRRDTRWNALQCLLETLFFFSPAIWWISSRLRAERECATDDYVLQNLGDPLPLIDALMQLAELRQMPSSHYPSAAGSDLLKRLQRLVHGIPTRQTSRKLFALLLFLMFLIQCSIPYLAGDPDSAGAVVMRVVVIQK